MPLHSPVWEISEPYLTRLRLYSVPDPTYGRWSLPHYPPHLDLIDDPEISHSFRRVFLPNESSFPTRKSAYEFDQAIHSEEVKHTDDELASGLKWSSRWIFYSIWEMVDEPKAGWEEGGKGRGRDLVLVHGLSDYGLRYAPHVKHFLRAGFRVIIPDLPSYGYSTGVNSYLPSARLLPASLQTVLVDLVKKDLNAGREQRKVFLSGASMGGWTVLYYILQYPPTASASKVAAQTSESRASADQSNSTTTNGVGQTEYRPQVAGAFVLCPMVTVSKESRPWKITEYAGRVLQYFVGPLPFAKAVRGNVSDDPRVEEDFFADPLCYHGYLRIATGLALLEGMIELEKRAEEIDIPIRLIHGSSDRTTSHLGTLKLFDRLPNADKEVEIYDGYEHVMMKVGIDEADDAKRQRVLADWRHWLIQRC